MGLRCIEPSHGQLFGIVHIDEVITGCPPAESTRLRHLTITRNYCPDATLARMEARFAIDRLIQRFPGLTLKDVRWNNRINLRKPSSLSITG
jgi:hypothetical protein